VGGTDVYALSLFLLPVLVLVGLGIWRDAARSDFASAFNRETAWVIVLVFAAYALISAPFFAASGGHALATSMGNLDIAEYATASRYLQEFIPATQQGFMGQTGHLIAFCRNNWFGPLAIVAIICSLLHAEPYQLQSLVMDVVAVQAVAFVYLLAREILGFGRLGSSVLAVLYALSPAPLFTIWQSFGGQAFAMSMMLALFFVQTHSLKGGFSRERSLTHLPATVILLTGISLSYHYMLAVAGMLLVAYLACHAYFSRQWRGTCHAGWFLAAAYAICGLLNLLRFETMGGEIALVKNAQVGWFIPWLSPDVIIGANAASLFTGIGDHNNRIFWAAVAMIPLLLAGWHLIRTPGAVNARSFFLGLLLPAFLVGLGFAYTERQNGIWGGYRSFKITASFSALILLGGAIAFAGCSWKRQRWRALLATALVAAFVSTVLANVWELARFTREHAFLPGPELVALKKIESMPFVKGINVMDADNFSLLWTNYFTLKTRQVYQRFPYGGRPAGILNQEFSLAKDMTAARAAGHSEDIFLVESSSFEAEYPISAWYILYKVQENHDVTITPAEGWWGIEPTHRWSGSKGAMCSVYIDAKTQGIPVQLEAMFFLPLGDGNFISAKVNGAPLEVTQDKIHLHSETFMLNAGRNLVEFRTSLMPSPPSARDPRTLGVAWASLIVKFTAVDYPNQAQRR
jgi:hypothetical protein